MFKHASTGLLTMLFVGMAARSDAGDTLHVAHAGFGVDADLGLVLVGQDIATLNAQGTGLKGGVELDGAYFGLEDPVAEVEVGTAYAVTDADGGRHTLYFTDLPLVWISADAPIVDEPKVPGRFRMHAEGASVPERLIGIEVRGGSSQRYAKKSYLMEFRADPEGMATLDVPLLDMRSDDDWNLQAMWVEPLRLRSVMGQRLWMDIHAPYYAALEPGARSGVDMRYVELFLNGAYRGLYAVSERVDRKQLALRKYDGAIKGKIYKGEDWGLPTLTGIAPYDNTSTYWEGFEYEYPEGHIDWSDLYDFLDLVVNSSGQAFMEGIGGAFHMANAVDYFLFLNLLRAEDNTGKNIFIARYASGTPYFYVPWDLDATFGISWEGTGQQSTSGILANGMYERLMADCAPGGFMDRARARWTELRNGAFAVGALMDRFTGQHDRLAASGAYVREEMAWATYHHDPTHLAYMEDWITARTAFLDAFFAEACGGIGIVEHQAAQSLDLFPNPASGQVTLRIPPEDLPCAVMMVDATGRTMLEMRATHEHSVLDLSGLDAGLYHVQLVGDGRRLAQGKLILR